MRGKLLFVFAAALLLVSFTPVEGDEKPVENAYVLIDWTDGKHGYSNDTLTDSQGYYEMHVAAGKINISAGTYIFRGHEFLMVGNFTSFMNTKTFMWANLTLPHFPDDTAKIYGYVMDNSTHSLINNANVTIYFEDAAQKYAGYNYTITQNGYYEICLPPSNVTIIVSAHGFFDVELNITIGNNEEKEVNISMDKMPLRTACIKGYVLNSSDNSPIENAEVTIFNNRSFNLTATNSYGYYELWMPSGNFTIYVDAKDYFPSFFTVQLNESKTKWANFSLTHYPPDEAWVNGVIIDSHTGSPIPGANVTVTGTIMLGLGGLGGIFERNATTDLNGYYNISVPASHPQWGIPQYSIIESVEAEVPGYFENSTTLSYFINPGRLNVNLSLDPFPVENCIVRGYVYVMKKAGNVLYVGGMGANNYTTIQAAINDASPGDTIKVYPGTYDGPIIINKEIKFIGDPTIDGHGGYGIKIEANNTLVENFTVFNCSYGICAHNFSYILQNVTIRNCTVCDCTGWGIHVYDVNNVTIENSTAYNVSAGIVIWNANGGKVKNNEVLDSGNALTISECDNLIISDNKLHDNSGDGIFVDGNSMHNKITSNDVYNNTGYHGGIYVDTSYYNKITNNYIYNNSKYGVYVDDSCHNTIFHNNIYKNGYDGIYLIRGSNNNSISSNCVHNNSQYGIVVFGSNNTINNNSIYYNQNGIVIKNTATNNNVTQNKMENNSICGIYLIGNNNTVKSNSIAYNYYGIYVYGDNNTILSNEIKKCNRGIYVGETAENNEIKDNSIRDSSIYEMCIYGQNNIFVNNTVDSTKFSFTYGGNLTIKNASMPAPPPPHWQGIGKFLEIENTGSAWMNIRIYYDDADVTGLLENTLKIWRYSGGWQEDGWNGSRYLNMAKNVVGVNITSFSIFAPLAMAPNHLPYATNPSPSNGSVDVSLNPTLSVVVYDADGDTMNVSFYDASSDTLIGYVNGVFPNNTAGIVWNGLDYETTYYWYVVINDSYGENKSYIWYFTTVQPMVVYVDDDYNEATPGWGETKFNKIQDAINAVAEGGVVYVYEGVYRENIIIAKSVNIEGEDKDIVIIGGNTTGDVVNISACYVNISGFTIRNSSLEPFEPFPAGVKVYQSSNVKISDCLLLENYAGILLLNASNVSITDNIVRGNEIDIFLQYSDKNIISENNCSNSNEGIWLDNSCNNSILDNNCSGNDIGIAIDYSNNNTISHCILDNLDGIDIFNSNNNTISHCTISDNLMGIQIKSNSANNSILYCTISNNNAGIFIYNSENVSIYYCNITNNFNGTTVNGGRYIEIHYNNIYGNKYYGVENLLNDVKYLVEATRNYWGSTDGPYHPTQNPDGKGDNITDNILFIPWFSSPIKIAVEKSIHSGMNDVDIINETDIHVVVDTIKENILRVISFGGAPVEEYPASIRKYVEIDVENRTAIEWPISIKLYYTQEDLNKAELSEDNLVGIYFYNESAGKWQLFNDTGVNTTNVVVNSIAYAGYAWANAWHITVITAGSFVKPSVVYVDDDYNASTPGWQYDHFASIQDGINAVAELGIVYVHEGIYDESIAVNKEISLISLGNQANTIIKASGENAVNLFAPCTIDGFTIRDAFSDKNNVRGIWVKADGCIIRNVTIMNITTEKNDDITIDAYGIMINYANNCTLQNVTIYDVNGGDHTAYGIDLIHTHNDLFKNITILNISSASIAYGIGAYKSGNNSFKNITIFNVTSASTAYGISCWHSINNEILNANISNINNGYGIDASYSSNLAIIFSFIHYINGTGIYLSHSSNNNISSNHIYNNEGKGIYIQYSSNNTIESNHIFNNILEGIVSTLDSNYNTIIGNYIYNNSDYGIWLSSSSCNNVSSNYIHHNDEKGIYLSPSANNNIIFSNTIYNNSHGVYLSNSNNNIIKSNNIFNHSHNGIHLSNSMFNTVSENYLRDNDGYGIYLDSNSRNNSIISNYIYNNQYYGMTVYSDNNNISSNYIYNNQKGIFLSTSSNNTISSNYIYNNSQQGILISYGNNNTVYGNYVYNNAWDGVSLSTYSSNNTILSNYIYDNSYDGIKLYYYTSNNTIKYNYIYNNSNGIRISYMNHTGNVIEQNYIYKNRNNGIYSDAYTKNNTIYSNHIYDNGEYGIYLRSDSGNITVVSNKIYKNNEGIVVYSANNNISSNEIYNNSLWGIQLQQAQNNIIMFNKVYNHTAKWNSAGIVAFSSSNYNNISSNIVYNNGIDNIELWNNSFYNIIWNNTVYGAEYGILLSKNANDNIIAQNTIYGNEYGISIGHDNTTWGGRANNNTIISNTIISNQYGIYLYSSNNNLIYNNYFNNTINAWDNGNNTWNISKTAGMNIVGGAWLGGNYWHDYAGVDNDGDDLGDTILPYNCSGNISDGGDWLPLLVPVNHAPAEPYSPVPQDGTTGIGRDVILQWQCYDIDEDTLTYDIYLGTSTSSLIKKASNITATSYQITNLQYSTTYYWRVVAWDEYGMKTIGPIWHFETKENSHPSKPILSGPSSGYVGSSIIFHVKANDEDGDKIRYGMDWDNDGIVDQWAGYYNPGIDASISRVWNNEGSYDIRAIAEDEYGAKSEWSDILHITITSPPLPPPSNQPPTISITSPSGNATANGTIIIQGTASDDNTVVKVEIRIDGGTWIQAAGTTSWSYSIDTKALNNGLHKIEARSYDGSLYSNTDSITINVFNNHKPVVAITEPSNNEKVKGIVVVKGKAWDEDGNESITKVEVAIDGIWHVANGTTLWNYSIDTTTLHNGKHIIKARCYDGHDYSNIVSISIDVENAKKKEISWSIIIAAILIIAILIIIAAIFIRK